LDSGNDGFSTNLMAMMTMFKRRREVATPIIDGEMEASDIDGSSAGWHVIDQTKTHMNKQIEKIGE
jgi:hypothetical protein